MAARWGRRVARWGGRVTDTARINIEIAFPEKAEQERQRMLSDAYANMGRVVAELALLQGPRRSSLLDSVRIEGLEHLAEAEAASPSGGVIVLTAHFGSWDLCAAALSSRGFPLSVVHRGFANPHLHSMITQLRVGDSPHLEQLQMGKRAVGGLLRSLREGRKLIVLADQNARPDEGVFVPFFSRLACTRYAPALIAMRRGVPILPAFVYRQGERAEHVVRIDPPLFIGDADPGDPEALVDHVALMTRSIENAIRSAPDHWLWAQRRWKTRPTDVTDPVERQPIYPSRR